MTIREQLTMLMGALNTWALTKGGRCGVAGDLVNMFELLGKPGGVRVVVIFSGEPKRGDYEEAGIVDRSFTVVISRGRGFTQGGDNLMVGQAGGQALFELAEEARDVVRKIIFDQDTTEVTADYKGLKLFDWPTGDAVVDAYQFEVTIGTRLPDLVE